MKRRLASHYPRRGRGRVLTAQGQGRRQKLSSNLHGSRRPARPRNRSKTPKEDKRWLRLTGTTAALTKSREFQHSRWECGIGERRRGVPTRPHVREWLRERQKVPHREKNVLSTGAGRWPWNHPPGDQCPTLGSEGWLQPNVCCQCSKGDSSWDSA